MEGLKPCPFCGGNVTIYYSRTVQEFFWEHKGSGDNCIMVTPALIRGKYRTPEEAFDAWNRRLNGYPEDPEPPDVLKNKSLWAITHGYD